MTTTLTAIVLAAGRGTRIGGPKALLPWDGIPLAIAHANVRARDCDAVLVVVRPNVAEVLCDERTIVSRSPDDWGPAGSIAAAVPYFEGAALITPVDCPPAPAHVIAQLRATGAQAARPMYRGRRGHPVFVQAEVLAPYRQPTGAPPPLRDVLRALGDAVVDVPVDDPHVLTDINTQEALAGYWRDVGRDGT